MSKKVAIDNGAIKKIVDAAKQGKLIVVVGAGLSKGLTNGVFPSWKELINSGLTYAITKGLMQEEQVKRWKEHLSSSDIDDLLGVAEFLGRKLGAPSGVVYERWLQEQFNGVVISNRKLDDAVRTLSSHNIPICTLNYDHLLEASTGLSSIHVSDYSKTSLWLRRDLKGILHLHGSFDDPKTCILGIRDYEKVLQDDVRDLFQRNLAAFNHLLFIGCGDTLSDPNFSALITWMRQNLKGAAPIHYALTLESEMQLRHQDQAWSGFVEPVSYGANHNDLATFLSNHFPASLVKKPVRKKEPVLIDSQSVIKNYQNFLIRDCGQMTIEGVSADLDTGQRKFDLERLFVPLKVIACPPDLPSNDPDGAEKLKEWHKLNSDAKNFGKVLATGKSLALLALPGGGKTLLLKRLAVAYADPARRVASGDELPDIDLLPVLIRCREWRDHIRLPIPTLLKNIGDITGQSNLAGLFDALVPRFKKGQVLLLVDGLDEIHNDADRLVFVDNLESFLDEFKKTRVVVTSREAGFNLVAPSIARFCERWRLAPLQSDAITMLCGHWHRLMSGDSPTALAEGQDVAQMLLNSDSLHRLAENPLLLTMLLVVKHGAGGLPPDRVSLYGRAVEVLLDTWNIRGHEPLNPKEAVPQLAYVAFQLMCSGKQTATEKELLLLLEEAREKHPSIKRYAKDSPYEFLKRVELRSSLLLEAGHQVENGLTVPFYQFRHLTFQEYLAAVAVNEGHYKEYQQGDTILTPLLEYLLVDEWKEVIPMTAVLARKRAEPLIIELIKKGQEQRAIDEKNNIESDLVLSDARKLSGPAGRLIQCFVEEAEASTETLTSALSIIAFFARGCLSSDGWESLCRGPYSEELCAQAWSQYCSVKNCYSSWIMFTCATFFMLQKPRGYWLSEKAIVEVKSLLESDNKDEIKRGILICVGIFWKGHSREEADVILPLLPQVEARLFNSDPSVFVPATWLWSQIYQDEKLSGKVSVNILDVLMTNILSLDDSTDVDVLAYALICQLGLPRNYWSPNLNDLQKNTILLKFSEETKSNMEMIRVALIFIAYHAKSVWSDQELLERLEMVKDKGIVPISHWKEKYDGLIKNLGGKPITTRGARKAKVT